MTSVDEPFMDHPHNGSHESMLYYMPFTRFAYNYAVKFGNTCIPEDSFDGSILYDRRIKLMMYVFDIFVRPLCRCDLSLAYKSSHT